MTYLTLYEMILSLRAQRLGGEISEFIFTAEALRQSRNQRI
jgi:hypothetical protein